jgi:aquaporin Z
MDESPLSRRLPAEAFGTFCLVFAGTGAAIVNEVTGGGVSHVGVALTFGLVVMVLIALLGDVSGCHVNPAVTLGLAAAGRFPPRLVPGYVAGQCAGAILASGGLRVLFPESVALGATIPAGSAMQSFVLEILLTLFLMVAVLVVSGRGWKGSIPAASVIGGLIGLEAIFAGPVSGASMNPARSLGPAVVSGATGHLWIYLIAPVVGAVAGVLVYRVIWSEPRGGADGPEAAA